ncbi:M20/M25/M40 family metallo-hydrolase [Terriglobus sp. TAA 43]|uniref:M20/M25/M40 family metallo-hydrolase n=1 Tax=Terriglobus sp. TAA 43 TaxID=278961 RepID=UPI00064697FC|nr:M20/M25/M40 family metallo-hydrolase [Terriglobus sp. TAA 43]
MARFLVHMLTASCLAVVPAMAQAPAVSDVNTQLRAQETKDSQLMWWLHEVTDVYGPRLTGSPGLKAAQDFAVKQMKAWGFQNVHLEPWNFNHPGWQNYETVANVTAPFQQPLNVRAVSWTPGTKGMVEGKVLVVEPPLPPPVALGRGGAFGRGGGPSPEQLKAMEQAGTSPAPMPAAKPEEHKPVTQADLDAYLASIKDKVKGSVIFYGPHVEVPENFAPATLRRPDEQWEQQAGRRGGFPTPPTPPKTEGLTLAEVTGQVNKFLIANGALAKVTDSGRAYGIVLQQSTAGYNENPDSPNLPTLVMGNEDYGRIYRTTKIDHLPVTIRLNVKSEFYPAGKTVYNVVGELPGTDKSDEVVMAGGHFDSWNPATGATDNAAGSTVAVEALRLIKVLNLPHRRTIRVALWSGEEQGLYGSLAYVAQHFGSAENPKPEWYKLDAYLNLDDGTSKPRAASVFGPPEAAAMVQGAMDNFKDWGFYHVSPTVGRQTGGTDSTSFNNAGLPGVGYSQDPFDYNTYTHHTSFDTYERIYEPDMREAAVEEALTLYALANADQMVPRCSVATMPAPPVPNARVIAARKSTLPRTPVEEFMLPEGATAPERPNPCTAVQPKEAAPVSWK